MILARNDSTRSCAKYVVNSKRTKNNPLLISSAIHNTISSIIWHRGRSPLTSSSFKARTLSAISSFVEARTLSIYFLASSVRNLFDFNRLGAEVHSRHHLALTKRCIDQGLRSLHIERMIIFLNNLTGKSTLKLYRLRQAKVASSIKDRIWYLCRFVPHCLCGKIKFQLLFTLWHCSEMKTCPQRKIVATTENPSLVSTAIG